MLSPITKKHLEDRLGKSIRYPSDFTDLANHVREITKVPLSANTLKRIFGFINEQREARLMTLDVLAKYLGFNHWDEYLINNKEPELPFVKDYSIILVSNLQQGTEIELHFSPEGRVIIKILSDFNFKVISSHSCRLMENDLIDIKIIYLNYPIFLKDVIRNENHLGQYILGRVSGITYFKIL